MIEALVLVAGILSLVNGCAGWAMSTLHLLVAAVSLLEGFCPREGKKNPNTIDRIEICPVNERFPSP